VTPASFGASTPGRVDKAAPPLVLPDEHRQGIKDQSLKKIIIMAVIAYGGWQIYQDQFQGSSFSGVAQVQRPSEAVQVSSSSSSRFRCDGRQYCSQMTSRAEAEFFTRNCPNTKMDGDHDGIPCENDSRF